MGNGMNRVLPGLYLGSFRDGKDGDQLRDNEITHIISIHDTAKQVVEDKEYLCIQVPDSPDENLSRHFSRCNDFIHRARSTGGNVLVHCLAGVSRSATIAAAYVMCATNLTLGDALKVVKGARSIANPNYGFHAQLKEYESYVLTQERKRIRIRYPHFDQRQNDEEACAQLISAFHANPPPPPTAQRTSSWNYRRRTSSASPASTPTHSRTKSRSASSSPRRGPR
ncbi:hypothetical protein JTE90_017264 [Oedothorax gibbosus]|uniref:Dual specificity protein phosphatase 15 n=1 Tax=Oedothorax gibbosus TaxID=931172 RepID=A0AAV6VFV8_9ARAC|nr:hypothetical protein JTE90_017264 [Oedothorax gibbosus]